VAGEFEADGERLKEGDFHRNVGASVSEQRRVHPVHAEGVEHLGRDGRSTGRWNHGQRGHRPRHRPPVDRHGNRFALQALGE
jgi:hypothetical protein